MYLIRFQTVFNPYSIRIQSVFNSYPIRIQSVFNPYSIRIQSIFNTCPLRIQFISDPYSISIESVLNPYPTCIQSVSKPYCFPFSAKYIHTSPSKNMDFSQIVTHYKSFTKFPDSLLIYYDFRKFICNYYKYFYSAVSSRH